MKQREQGEATIAAARKIWVLLELLRSGSVRFSTYSRLYASEYRTFQRDLQHLRNIGKSGGFTISPIREGERAEMLEVDHKLRSLDGSAHVLALLGALGGALGAPVSLELGELAGVTEDAGFLRFVMPQLLEQSKIAERYEALKAAWEVRPGPAMVRFKYRDGVNGAVERLVEPYRVLLRSGSAYLVAYDLDRKDWRMFAIDRMTNRPVRAGTILQRRTVPAMYDSGDTIGFIKSHRPAVAVTIRLSARVAASAASRRWQAAQRVTPQAGGAVDITFEVADVNEVIRWALGYGTDAVVVAPPEAVALARKTANEIATGYATPA